MSIYGLEPVVADATNVTEIFSNNEFGELTVIEMENEPWFIGNEVATTLGYSNTWDALANHVDTEDKKRLNFKAHRETRLATLWKGNDFSDKTLINESGLYSLVLSSKLESAKRFKRWVTKEVLPSIRQKGSYQAMVSQVSPEIRAILNLDNQTQILHTKVEKLTDTFERFVDNETLTPAQTKLISSKIQKVGVNFLGGKDSEAYNFENGKVRRRVYINLYTQLKRAFGLNGNDPYMLIKRVDFERAMAVIDEFLLPNDLVDVIYALNGKEVE